MFNMCVRRIAAAGVLLAASAGTAVAGSITFDSGVGNEATGSSFSASLVYTASSSTAATLEVILTNTTPASIPSFLVSFAMNNPDEAISSMTLASSSGTFADLLGGPNFDDNTVDADPLGDFDFGATTTGDFQGGGAPSLGLGNGESAAFTFNVVGVGLDAPAFLDLSAFVNETAPNASGGFAPQFFATRFRGVGPGGNDSDKVPGDITTTTTTSVVPEPSSFALLGLAIVGLGLIRRRRSPQPRATADA